MTCTHFIYSWCNLYKFIFVYHLPIFKLKHYILVFSNKCLYSVCGSQQKTVQRHQGALRELLANLDTFLCNISASNKNRSILIKMQNPLTERLCFELIFVLISCQGWKLFHPSKIQRFREMSKAMMPAKRAPTFVSSVPLHAYLLTCREKQILQFVDDYAHQRTASSTADRMLSFTSSYSTDPAGEREKHCETAS